MTRAILVAACLLGARAAMAADPVPNQFTPGTAAEAAKVNANFSDLVAKITALETQLGAAAVPVGTVLAFAGDASAPIPPGFLLCDGSAVSRSTYAALFAVVGIAHGGGNGTSTFNLPDYRGRFLRGRDAGAGRDPDAASRSAPQPGAASTGVTGDEVGSVQADALVSHLHGLTDPGHRHTATQDAHQHELWADWTQTSGSGAHGWNAAGVGNQNSGCVGSDRKSGRQPTTPQTPAISVALTTTGISMASFGGHETRPENANVNYVIKH